MEFHVIEYIYRGFKISYKMEPAAHENNGYKAAGHATYLLSKPKIFPSTTFQTEYDTHTGTEHEIRTLLENHVDFELKNLYEMVT